MAAAGEGGALGPSNPKEKALWDAFQRFDVNSDGKIQAEEFQRLMKSLGSFSNKEINRLFKEADSDGSGTLDWREFIKWICTGTATKTMSPDSAASFARLLTRETRDEASFAEQAAASRQLTAYLKEAHQDKSEADKAREQKRKQIQAKKKASSKEKEQALPTNGSGVTDASLGISEGYTGFRLPLPVTQEGAQALLEHYLMNGDTDPLHPKYVNYLTTQFTQIYREKHPKSVVYTETPKPGRLVVVGDTHGQLADVCHILYHLGAPSATNRFLFNGDMVDRGPYGVEILLIIFAFFLADPDCLIVHRGNHENEDMNALDADAGGGFIDEVMRKYGLMAYRRFVSAFKAFSLCSVVEKEIFVVHGGLSRVASMSIDYLNSIDHTEVTAPHPMATNIKDQVFSDLVWSDPTDQPGKYKSERGIGIKFGQDITTKFCMQNRLRFVIRSHQVPDDGRGYMKQHDGRCVTIFSASNYCGDGGNYGAVLVLDSQHFPRYEIIEHYAVALEDMPRLLKLGETGAKEKQKAESEEATTAKRWERELEKMIIGIIEKKPALWAHLVDLSLGTSLDAETWKEMMQEFIEGDHPWLEGARHWGSIDKFGRVHMDKFLNRWIVNMESEKYSSFLNQAVKHVYEAVVGLDMDLNKTLKLFDVDGDGSVDLKEVRQVLGMFNLGLTGSQLDRLTGQIFSQASRVARDQGDGKAETNTIKMNVQEFLGHFTVVYKQTGGGSTAELSDFATEALNAIGGLMMRTPADKMVSDLEKAAVKIQKCFRGVAARKEVKDLKEKPEEARGKTAAALPSPSSASGQPSATSPPVGTEGMSQQASKMVALFRAMDASGDGILQTDEFVQGLLTLPGIQKLEVQGLALTEERLRQVAQAVDSFGNGNGTINYLEFLQAFESMEEGNMDIANTLGEDITTVLFRHRLAIRMGCQYLDEEGSGKVKADDFNTVLNGVNSVLARPERALTTTQISLLVEALKETVDGEDTVDYDAFLRAFVILDTERDRAVVKRF